MRTFLLCAIALTLACVLPVEALQTKPIELKGLTDALKIGGLSTLELIDIIQQRGVDFLLTAETEKQLKDAGAALDVINAVRDNYRGAVTPASPPPPAPAPSPNPAAGNPLAKSEIITLLQVGTPSATIEQLVGKRGVNFSLTPEITSELTAAGGLPSLLDAIASKTGTPSAAPPVVSNPAASKVTSLKDVHKIFVDKMPNDLDKYLRNEIGGATRRKDGCCAQPRGS